MTSKPSLQVLARNDSFIHRHIGPSTRDIESMLDYLEIDSLTTLIEQTVPASIRRQDQMVLKPPCSETHALKQLRQRAEQNQLYKSFIGMGYYDTHVPQVIQRNVLENPGWYTAYTPYQPEISQGRLEALLNFQQMIIDLTGMELANASLLDEATAAAEAMALCKRVVKKNRSQIFFIAEDCHPQTIAVVKTRADHFGMTVFVGDPQSLLENKGLEYFGVLLQYPSSYGDITDIKPIIEKAHQNNAIVTVAADLMSLALLTPPGELGADVVIGNAQRFGVPMGFGGPHAAFFATREQFKRSIPGRVIGVSQDSHGNPALRMALQTREQHIRREKATSNICTSQALLAILSGFYACYHGPEGIKTIAQRIHRLTAIVAKSLSENGFKRRNNAFFDTLTIQVEEQQQTVLARAETKRLNLRAIDELTGSHYIGISLDETTEVDDVIKLLSCFGIDDADIDRLDDQAASGIPADLARQSPYLQHPIFNSHHSETEMLRYLKQLESKDIALNHSMIALGSCTMKLNATAEMIPITWPEFASIHPFAPRSQVAGYHQMIQELEHMLVTSTGYDAVSMQPNAGSQGEYAGLLVIKKYHQSQGQTNRDVCLIPSSAHGTNPASAAMAGMRVVIVACDHQGNVDLGDLRNKAEVHNQQLAAIMVTYPSTHGVFEEGIREVCDIVHQHGGQVYVDGANMNALVGLSAPGQFGADVSHLNLHKTFAIPHGGGGPGMGPIAVKSHLVPFLPNHPVVPLTDKDNDVISAAPWGSASILPISWMYIRMMGATGLQKATEVAILNANYIAKRLSAHYPVLYTGRQGWVAHECIIDLRPLKEQTGISEEDIAKRLMDYGFHAPTMSFPVPGTLMIEPTESEPLSELDRFCEAMISIREEINQLSTGTFDKTDNPLINAPHTANSLLNDNWSHAYPRAVAAYPVAGLRHNKYWPPVGRIDNVFGDRNLFCACPAVEGTE